MTKTDDVTHKVAFPIHHSASFSGSKSAGNFSRAVEFSVFPVPIISLVTVFYFADK